MNRSGFTTVEVVIASALIVVLITGGAIGMRQMNLLGQVATTRTSHNEMRTRVLEALLDSSQCANNLGRGTPEVPFLPDPKVLPLPVPPEAPFLPLTRVRINAPLPLESDPAKTDPSKTYENLKYVLGFRFPNPVFETFLPSTGRPNQTIRYRAELEVRADRDNLIAQGGKQAPLLASIPISLEFNEALGTLESCTVNANELEDVIAGGAHTVRDCLREDGVPFPTDQGLICRIPRMVVNTPTYAGAIPGCPLGWAPVLGSSGIHYNSAVMVDAEMDGCNGKVQFRTGWHYLSPTALTPVTLEVKAGQCDANSWSSGGASFTKAHFIALLGGIGAMVVFLINLSKCKKENCTRYPQVNAVGCR